MLHLRPTPEAPTDTERLAERIAMLIAPYPSDRERLARLLVELISEKQREMQAEMADLRYSVIAFAAPWATNWAQDHGLPRGHLHPTHYDILARAGARMTDFVRSEART